MCFNSTYIALFEVKTISCAGNGFPAWGVGAALLPALLATVLFFVEQHITEAIVNKKGNKLKVRGVYYQVLIVVVILEITIVRIRIQMHIHCWFLFTINVEYLCMHMWCVI